MEKVNLLLQAMFKLTMSIIIVYSWIGNFGWEGKRWMQTLESDFGTIHMCKL